MRETFEASPIDTEQIKKDTLDGLEPPSSREIEHRMAALDARDVTIDLECFQCGEPTTHRVLPEEQDENVTVCRSCAESHCRDVGLL